MKFKELKSFSVIWKESRKFIIRAKTEKEARNMVLKGEFRSDEIAESSGDVIAYELK